MLLLTALAASVSAVAIAEPAIDTSSLAFVSWASSDEYAAGARVVGASFLAQTALPAVERVVYVSHQVSEPARRRLAADGWRVLGPCGGGAVPLALCAAGLVEHKRALVMAPDCLAVERLDELFECDAAVCATMGAPERVDGGVVVVTPSAGLAEVLAALGRAAGARLAAPPTLAGLLNDWAGGPGFARCGRWEPLAQRPAGGASQCRRLPTRYSGDVLLLALTGHGGLVSARNDMPAAFRERRRVRAIRFGLAPKPWHWWAVFLPFARDWHAHAAALRADDARRAAAAGGRDRGVLPLVAAPWAVFGAVLAAARRWRGGGGGGGGGEGDARPRRGSRDRSGSDDAAARRPRPRGAVGTGAAHAVYRVCSASAISAHLAWGGAALAAAAAVAARAVPAAAPPLAAWSVFLSWFWCAAAALEAPYLLLLSRRARRDAHAALAAAVRAPKAEAAKRRAAPAAEAPGTLASGLAVAAAAFVACTAAPVAFWASCAPLEVDFGGRMGAVLAASGAVLLVSSAVSAVRLPILVVARERRVDAKF